MSFTIKPKTIGVAIEAIVATKLHKAAIAPEKFGAKSRALVMKPAFDAPTIPIVKLKRAIAANVLFVIKLSQMSDNPGTHIPNVVNSFLADNVESSPCLIIYFEPKLTPMDTNNLNRYGIAESILFYET